MYAQDIEVDDETITVEQGDVFHIDSELNFGEGRTLEEGNVVTVANIIRYPDGVHFEFTVDGEPGRIETILEFALELNLQEGHMHQKN